MMLNTCCYLVLFLQIKKDGKDDGAVKSKSLPTSVSGSRQTPKMKTVTWASAALPKYRKDRKISKQSPEVYNGKISIAPLDISLIQVS